MRKKAFTLIELIAVLVILAILALIVTPLVMNIIRKARISADKRSIDVYGRSVELAIATYLLDNGDFPNSISDLTIEYSGDQVVCSITQLNSDSSVYITGCTVGGRTVDYVYGSDKSPSYTTYQVGDELNYNNVNYYVIKDSEVNESTVTLLKAEPLTVEEVNQYGTGHINRYTDLSIGTAYNYNSSGYGLMAYYTSETCKYVEGNYVNSGCTNDYANSDIKYVVDAWKVAKVPLATSARLLESDDFEQLGYERGNPTPSDIFFVKTVNVPSWMYNSNYWYWTQVPKDAMTNVWTIHSDGDIGNAFVGNYNGVVRPVIILSKTLINA